MKEITIVDYGLGNIHSVAKSFLHIGCSVQIDTDGVLIPAAKHLVLPGVGAFADGMAGLQQRGQAKPLQQYGRENRPLLGICLGAQLLLEESEEFGCHEGLGLIAGSVRRIAGDGVKVPHIGWAQLLPSAPDQQFNSLFRQLSGANWCYFIHSYQMQPIRAEHVSAICRHGPHIVTAAVQQGSIHGTQFHPEKSGESGLTVLRAFASL